MLPGRARLREIAASSVGSLVEVPYPVLLAALALANRDVLAVLKRRQTEKQIVFSGGAPVKCTSNLLHETFGRFLVGQGKLSEPDFDLALAQSTTRHLRLGEVLVERGLFSQEEIDRLLHQNLARNLLDGFTWHEGTYELFPAEPSGETAGEATGRLHVGQLILTGVAKFAKQESIDSAVGALVGKRLALNPDPPFPLAEMKLTENQSRVAAALEKRPRIDELAVEANLPYEDITRILYGLFLLGAGVTTDQALPRARSGATAQTPATRPSGTTPIAITPARTPVVSSFERSPAPAAQTTASPQVPSPPPVHAPPQVPASHAAGSLAPAPGWALSELRRDFEAARDQDSFDLLGLKESAEEPQARTRFLVKARAWAPWQFEGEDSEKAAALFLAAARAYARIADPEGRDALRRARRPAPAPEPPKESAGAFVPRQPTRIRTDVLDPESQYRKGAALLASEPARALQFLEFAADCDPQKGTYAADVAWCRYLISGRMNPTPALAALEQAFRIDPTCGLACFYAGEILRARGDVERAENYYRKAAKLMAPDRRPLDALTEMAKKKEPAR